MQNQNMSSTPKKQWLEDGYMTTPDYYSPRASSFNRYSFDSDSVITIPVQSQSQRFTQVPPTPEFIRKIEDASPGTAKHMAIRMYESMKRHGLRVEAGKAIKREIKDDDDEVDNEGVYEVRKKSVDLMGMDYWLRDGFVSYLRDIAKINPPIPRQVVRFSGIKYSRKIDTWNEAYETFGSKVWACFVGPLKTLFKKENSRWLNVLQGVDGYIMPGSMTLLLGPPGCGKSTLLEVLAGRVDETNSTNLQGKVVYNDKTAFELRLSRLIAYISGQLHKHIPFLTVRETLEFAKDCTQGLRPENFTPQMRKFFAHALVEGQDPFLEYVLEILKLKTLEHKLTGEAISEIERQKLTTAELALGTYSVVLYDQPITGSDLAATYNLVDTIRTISRIQQSSAIMSLTQISEEVFNLFDRIILLAHGHVLFQGPRQDSVTYFTKLGYKKPSHVESAEFLEDIAAGHGSQYMNPETNPPDLGELIDLYEHSNHYKDITRIVNGDEVNLTYWVESEPGIGLSLKNTSKSQSFNNGEPREESELVVAKLSTPKGQLGGIESTGSVQIGDRVTAISINNAETWYLALGTQKNTRDWASIVYAKLNKARGPIRLQVERHNDENHVNQAHWEQFQRPYVQTWWRSTKSLINRQIKITKRLQAILKLRLFQAIVLGVFSGTLFYQLGDKNTQQEMNSVRALGFVSTMSIMLLNIVQLPLYMLQRPIFYKHRAQKFFRASSYVVAQCIVNLPQTIIEALAYTLCVYFLAGLSFKEGVAPFFEYLVLLVLVAYFGSSIFFFLSTISSITEVGNALAGLLVSIFLLFSGFVIYPSKIPAYWKWLLKINPIHWANLLYCRSQFGGYNEPCYKYIGELTFCESYPKMTVGKAYMIFYEVYESNDKPWLPFVIILGWILIINILALLGLHKVKFTETSQSLPSRRKRPALSNYMEDTKSGGDSVKNNDISFKDYNSSRQSSFSSSVYRNMKGNAVDEEWTEEFRVDLENDESGLTVELVTLLFEDLSFTRHRNEEKEITSVFTCITGYARPRNMLALLGGPKSSKETLLKCLAGRAPSNGTFTGNLQANEIKPGPTFFRLTGYVEKLDAHQPYLSVRESVQFSAALRLGQGVDPLSCRIHVELVLSQLGLITYSNQLVKSLRDTTGKTYEIAKKMTIAVELAANPSILFLEEPISGLDSTGALSILNALYRVSESGRVIVATLTHPSARSIAFFDQILFLTQEGRQAYFGPVGSYCSDLLDYFTSIPKVPQYFMIESPVSFVMGALGQGIITASTTSLNFAEIYKVSSLNAINNKEISAIKKSIKTNTLKYISSTYPAPFSRQASLVFLRTQRLLWRNVQYTYSRLIGCIMIGLLMGTLYYQIEYKDVLGVTSRSLYIYMQVILIGVVSANNVIPQLGTDRLVYFRERRAGMYLPIFYPVSWAIAEIPYFLIATFAMVAIGNGMAGIGTGSIHEFLMYWLALFMFTVGVTYFGMMVTFIAPVPTLAAFVVSIVTSLWISASGVVVLFSDIKFYKWMYWSNPFQFSMNVMTSISFYCDTTKCTSDCTCPQLPDGTYVWDRLAAIRSFNQARINTDFITLSGMCLLFAFLAFLFFVFLKHNSIAHV